MRFVVAGVAAFVVLMLDFDALPVRGPSNLDPVVRISAAFETILDTAPLLSLVASASVTDEPGASVEPLETETAVEAPRATPEEEFCRTLKSAAEDGEIPLAFFARLIWQESGFRSREISHAGAQGVAQFMPETAAEVGLDNPFDPLKALPASARLLAKLREQFGNLGLAAAAYNAGAGRIQKWLAKESSLPRETRDYVRIITGTAAESWTAEARTASIRLDLPDDAPCEGVGGLSKSKNFALVPVSLSPTMSAVIKKAEAAAQAEAKSKADRARKRLALRLKTRTARKPGAAHSAERRATLAARPPGKGVQHGRQIHLASR